MIKRKYNGKQKTSEEKNKKKKHDNPARKQSTKVAVNSNEEFPKVKRGEADTEENNVQEKCGRNVEFIEIDEYSRKEEFIVIDEYIAEKEHSIEEHTVKDEYRRNKETTEIDRRKKEFPNLEGSEVDSEAYIVREEYRRNIECTEVNKYSSNDEFIVIDEYIAEQRHSTDEDTVKDKYRRNNESIEIDEDTEKHQHQRHTAGTKIITEFWNTHYNTTDPKAKKKPTLTFQAALNHFERCQR